MKKALCLWLWAGVFASLALSAPARAQGERLSIDVANAAVSETGAELQLSFLDRTPVRHACDYFVSRFEYVSGIEPGLLLVELRSPEPCLVDRFGRRAGQLKWTVPSPIRGAGRLTVVLNGVAVGEVQLVGTEVNFIPSTR